MSTDMRASAGSPAKRMFATLALALALLAGPAVAGEQLTVTIDGLSGELLTNVESYLSIQRLRGNEALDAETIRELHGRAEREIHRALEPFGYYRPDITAELVEPAGGTTAWRAVYQVDPGNQVALVAVDVRLAGPGADDSELADLAAAFPLREQSHLDHRRYASAKNTLLSQVREKGYLDADYTEHRVEVDLARYEASATLRLDTGPRYVFGPISLEQQRFAPEYLERYLSIQPGQPFSRRTLTQQRNALSGSGHFQEVRVETGDAVAAEQPAIPVTIYLTPYKNNRYRGQVGWGTDTGFGLQVDWTRRQLGRHGHRFVLGGAAVEDRNRLAGDFSYIIPLNPLNGSHLELGARHQGKDLDYQEVELEEGGKTRIEANFAHLAWHLPTLEWNGFGVERAAGLSLVNENYDVFEVLFGNLSQSEQERLIGIIGEEAYATLAPDFEVIAPGLTLTLRRADDPLHIRRGDYLNLQVLGTDESLGSNISFWQARMNTWTIRPVGDSGRFLLRSSLGYSDADSRSVLGINFNQMPEEYEFRAGGARSVRGYAYDSLIAPDTITGGKHQIVASVEYEHEFIPDWSAAVFLDGGNAFNDFDDIDEKLGAGIGLRWRSPVGLARVDLAFPLDDADDSFQIYITIGPEF